MLFWDVNNGIARRSWARNKEANFAIKREMERTPNLKVTSPNLVDEAILNTINLLYENTNAFFCLSVSRVPPINSTRR